MPAASAPSTDLPVEASVPAVRDALGRRGCAVLTAPPGAGKTTVVPLRLLGEPWLDGSRIVVLEPRRLATRAAAVRMAALLGEDVGETVGYRTRDERRTTAATRIEVVTEGILTRRLQRDPSLPDTALVVFDEVHERNLHTDLALALTLDAQAALRPDLRILAMSATLDADRVAALIGGDGGPAPVVTSEGRAHPVTIRWAPPPPRQRPAVAVAGAVARALREQHGDVLVFLPGAADIRRAELELRPAVGPDVDVRPLYGALPTADQDAALTASPPGRRRVVLATDIAETSLTVAGVRVVVDAGLARSPRFDPRTGLTSLRTHPASRASTEQRAGRAGRTAPGVAYRLWSKLEHAARPAHSTPEIASVDLAGLVLELAIWGASADELAFLDPPPATALDEGRAVLVLLGALDGDGRPTDRGRAMADLPLHPRLARMVLAGDATGDGWLACLLGALLEERDVLRGRPDDVPVDVAERVRLLADREAHHPLADRGVLHAVGRRGAELARRAGIRRGPVDLDGCGRVLADAYPDRVAQARGGGRFRLRTGTGAWVPAGDPLVNERFLVVADLDAGRRDSRVRLAAALDADDVVAAAGADVTTTTTVAWDDRVDDLRSRVERRLDALVLASHDGPPEPGPATVAALVERARATRLAALGWSDDARALQARSAFVAGLADLAAAADHAASADVGDDALLTSLDDWLVPLLAGATGRADLARVDMGRTLRSLLGHHRLAELDRLAPARIPVASGRTVAVDYSGETPVAAVRIQEVFGSREHPTVGGGRVPVVLHLLSPAGRSVQITADLPGFWRGSWTAVRKDMAGRYPKHDWPEDPATARPHAGTGRRPADR